MRAVGVVGRCGLSDCNVLRETKTEQKRAMWDTLMLPRGWWELGATGDDGDGTRVAANSIVIFIHQE